MLAYSEGIMPKLRNAGSRLGFRMLANKAKGRSTRDIEVGRHGSKGEIPSMVTEERGVSDFGRPKRAVTGKRFFRKSYKSLSFGWK